MADGPDTGPSSTVRGLLYNSHPFEDHFLELWTDNTTSSVSSKPMTGLTVNLTMDSEGAGNMTVRSLSIESQRVLIAIYTFTILLAVVGNLLVIIIFIVSKRSRTDLRMFLLNLALADLIMAVFCMPFTFSYTMLHEWTFGPVMCTLVSLLQLNLSWLYWFHYGRLLYAPLVSLCRI